MMLGERASRRGFLAALGVLAAAAAVGAPPARVLAQTQRPARLDLREFQSASFTFDTYLEVPDDDLSFSGEGALAPPDAVQLRLRLNRKTIEMIRLGKERYIRSSLLGDPNQWYTAADESSLHDLDIPEDADPLDVFRSVRLMQYDFTPLDPATLDGAATDHYRTTLKGPMLSRYQFQLARGYSASAGNRVKPDSLQAQDATFELWLASDTRYLLKSHVNVELALGDASAGAGGSGGGATGQWPPSGQRSAGGGSKTLVYEQTFRFTDLDAAPAIVAPTDAVPLPH